MKEPPQYITVSPKIISLTGPSSIPVLLEGRARKILCVALVDTGNRISAGVAINSVLAESLQLEVHQLTTSVGTAGNDQHQVLGEVRNVRIWIAKDCRLLLWQAWIIPKLNHEVNIGSEWLGENKAAVDYHYDPPSLRVGLRENPLINNMSEKMTVSVCILS